MIPAGVRIFVCSVPQDMRRSFDGLSLAAQEHLGEDPGSGALFVFVNKRANRLKVLWFDRNRILPAVQADASRAVLLAERANDRAARARDDPAGRADVGRTSALTIDRPSVSK